jgi:protein involved in polysaccharide export with SLBB domain
MLTMKKLGIAILLLTAPTGLWGQQNHAVAAVSSPVATPAAVTPNTADDRPGLQKRNPRYQIQRDDVLILSFALSPELNQTVTVQPDGYITLLSAGSLYIQGMTVPEVTAAIKQDYSKTLRDPIVDVDLKDFQKPYFVALGQVGKPGQYDLRYEMTVTEAIAVAGGFNPTARTQVFLYHRVGDQWVEAKELNIKQILQGKNVGEDPRIGPGDMIFVPEKFITKLRKYIPYGFGTGISVANPTF